MYKILIGIILIMTALTACATPPQMGTGGYDPETQALLAIATQTGAAALISQTQAAQSATAQAIYAEQTAVASYATATQVTSENATIQAVIQATAVSATETRIYEPVGIQQTRDAQAVLMARENTASTATAEAIHLEMRQATKSAERWDRFWKGFMWFLAGLGAALVIAAINIALRFHKPVPPVYSDDGIAQAVDSRFYQLTNGIRPSYRPQPVLIDQQKETAPPINNMRTDTRTVSGSRNGKPHEWVLPEENPVKDETWQKLAVALLVSCVPFSREAVLDRTKRNWIYGRMSQPEYNAAYEFMRERGLVGGKMGNDKMTPALYEFLEDYIPSHEEIALPHPDESEIIDTR